MKVTQEAIAAANRRITADMTVGEARLIKAKKAAVLRKFEKAALAHIRTTDGRDLEAERTHWTTYSVATNAGATGVVTVRQYAASEMTPGTLRQTWTINKKKLVK